MSGYTGPGAPTVSPAMNPGLFGGQFAQPQQTTANNPSLDIQQRLQNYWASQPNNGYIGLPDGTSFRPLEGILGLGISGGIGDPGGGLGGAQLSMGGMGASGLAGGVNLNPSDSPYAGAYQPAQTDYSQAGKQGPMHANIPMSMLPPLNYTYNPNFDIIGAYGPDVQSDTTGLLGQPGTGAPSSDGVSLGSVVRTGAGLLNPFLGAGVGIAQGGAQSWLDRSRGFQSNTQHPSSDSFLTRLFNWSPRLGAGLASSSNTYTPGQIQLQGKN